MTAAVFSDTHGNTRLMKEAIRKSHPDIIIHLGDCEQDAEDVKEEFPYIPMYNVAGNCGSYIPGTPYELLVPLGRLKAFLTHGHLYNPKSTRHRALAEAAARVGADIVLYGHSHQYCDELYGGIRIINPGTAGKGSNLSYAFIRVKPNREITVEKRIL